MSTDVDSQVHGSLVTLFEALRNEVLDEIRRRLENNNFVQKDSLYTIGLFPTVRSRPNILSHDALKGKQ